MRGYGCSFTLLCNDTCKPEEYVNPHRITVFRRCCCDFNRVSEVTIEDMVLSQAGWGGKWVMTLHPQFSPFSSGGTDSA